MGWTFRFLTTHVVCWTSPHLPTTLPFLSPSPPPMSTTSRSASLQTHLLLSFHVWQLLPARLLMWLLPLLLILASPLLLAVLPGVPSSLHNWGMRLLPDQLLVRVLESQGETAWKHTRLAQWQYALQLVAARPWFGWGAAAFSVLYPIHAAKRWHGHVHNLPLELAVSHGLPAMLLALALCCCCWCWLHSAECCRSLHWSVLGGQPPWCWW